MRQWWDLVPARVRRPVETFRTMWRVGAFARPLDALEQLRHRQAFQRVQKALFYQRWATALLAAHELGLFDRLAAGPASAAELAAATGAHAAALEALLRILEAEHLVRADGTRWSLTSFAQAYLSRDASHSIAGMIDLVAAQATAFAELPAALRAGKTPAVLDIFQADSRYQAFLRAVNDYLGVAGRDLLRQVDLGEVRSFIVGSMGVSFSALVLEKHPSARVTYGCLAHLVAEIPRLRTQFRVPPARVEGMHAHGGDPGADRWGGEDFDLVFLTKKMMLQPELRIGEKFARKAFEVLRPGGTAIFWETVQPAAGVTPVVRAMEAVLDLVASPTGGVQTDAGLSELLRGIGFSEVRMVECLGGQTTFVVARKRAG
jgi:hypothetical protein